MFPLTAVSTELDSPCLSPKLTSELLPDFSPAQTIFLPKRSTYLPEELLVAIFSKLSLLNLMQARQVCKDWHRLADEPCLVNLKDLGGFGLATNGLPSYFQALQENRRLHALEIPSSLLMAISSQYHFPKIAANERIIAVANVRDRSLGILIFDLYSRHLKANLQSHEGNIRCLAIDEQMLISSADDCSVKIWDLTDFSLKKTLNSFCDVVYKIWITASKLIFKTFQMQPDGDGFNGHHCNGVGKHTFAIYNRQSYRREKRWELTGAVLKETIEDNELCIDSYLNADFNRINVIDLESLAERVELYSSDLNTERELIYQDKAITKAGGGIFLESIDPNEEEEPVEMSFYKHPLTALELVGERLILASWKKTIKIFNLKTQQIQKLECPNKQRIFSLIALKDRLVTLSYHALSRKEIDREKDWHEGRQPLNFRSNSLPPNLFCFQPIVYSRPLPIEIRIWNLPAT